MGGDLQPGAYVDTYEGKIRFYQARLKPQKVEEEPGRSLSIDQSGIHAATSDAVITLGKVQPEKRGKMLATEYVNTTSPKVGYCLGKRK